MQTHTPTFTTQLSVAVSPFIVPREHAIASTNGSTNIVNIASRSVPEVTLPFEPPKQPIYKLIPPSPQTHQSTQRSNLVSSAYIGPGAGRYPTANSVVNDIVRLARGLTGPPFPVDRQVRASVRAQCPCVGRTGEQSDTPEK